MSAIRYIKCRSHILSVASDAIDKYENELIEEGKYTISCKDDILNEIKKELPYYKKDLSETDYSVSHLTTFAMSMVFNCSFQLFQGDLYRVFGQINFTGPANNAYYVYKKVLKYALDNGLTTQEEADESLLALQDLIKLHL